MPTFDVETEEIRDRYIFKAYFDEDQL